MRTIGLVVVACVISCAYVVNIVEIRGVEGDEEDTYEGSTLER